MRKLNCYICDGCRVVLGDGFRRVAGRRRNLDFCRKCADEWLAKDDARADRHGK